MSEITGLLTQEETRRYARHLRMPEIGVAGQLKLKNAKILLAGMGGLGCPAALYLAAAGIGTLGLCDADKIDLSNLQRQVLFATPDIGRAKTESAQEKLQSLNPHLRVNSHDEMLTTENATHLIADYDLVIDGTDNFAAHYLINDACVIANKPFVYGNVQGFEGQIGFVAPKSSACYRCLYPAAPPPELAPNCAEAGVLGVVPGLIGILQATEALKFILGIGENLQDRILRVNALTMDFRSITTKRDVACTVCGNKPSIAALDAKNYGTPACAAEQEISAEELRAALTSKQPPFLLDVRNPNEFAGGSIDGARLIPLPELAARLNELDPTFEMVVYCQSGRRSAEALRILRAHDFVKARNLKGGYAAFAPLVEKALSA